MLLLAHLKTANIRHVVEFRDSNTLHALDDVLVTDNIDSYLSLIWVSQAEEAEEEEEVEEAEEVEATEAPRDPTMVEAIEAGMTISEQDFKRISTQPM